MKNVIPMRTLKGAGTPAVPYRGTVDERQEVASEQWRRVRTRHLQLAATINSSGMLRLHNGGRLPSQPGPHMEITPAMLAGMRREMQEVVDLAKDAVDALVAMEQVLRGKP